MVDLPDGHAVRGGPPHRRALRDIEGRGKLIEVRERSIAPELIRGVRVRLHLEKFGLRPDKPPPGGGVADEKALLGREPVDQWPRLALKVMLEGGEGDLETPRSAMFSPCVRSPKTWTPPPTV